MFKDNFDRPRRKFGEPATPVPLSLTEKIGWVLLVGLPLVVALLMCVAAIFAPEVEGYR